MILRGHVVKQCSDLNLGHESSARLLTKHLARIRTKTNHKINCGTNGNACSVSRTRLVPNNRSTNDTDVLFKLIVVDTPARMRQGHGARWRTNTHTCETTSQIAKTVLATCQKKLPRSKTSSLFAPPRRCQKIKFFLRLCLKGVPNVRLVSVKGALLLAPSKEAARPNLAATVLQLHAFLRAQWWALRRSVSPLAASRLLPLGLEGGDTAVEPEYINWLEKAAMSASC